MKETSSPNVNWVSEVLHVLGMIGGVAFRVFSWFLNIFLTLLLIGLIAGIIVSTAAEKPSWSANLHRLLWDIRSYRKDYVCLVMNGVFPAKTTAVCRVRTTFALQKDPEKWIADAEALCGKLRRSFAADNTKTEK